MSGPSQPSRRTAIAMIVVAVAAFAGILAGLAIGRLEVAGVSAVVLVVVWFVLRHIQRRGGAG